MPTAHRLVAQFLNVGFPERVEGHRVCVGLHRREIAALGASAPDLREAAMSLRMTSPLCALRRADPGADARVRTAACTPAGARRRA